MSRNTIWRLVWAGMFLAGVLGLWANTVAVEDLETNIGNVQKEVEFFVKNIDRRVQNLERAGMGEPHSRP